MISISHWGMFAGARFIGSVENTPVYECDDLDGILPVGFSFKDRVQASKERFRPDGVIEIVRIG